MFAAIKLSLRLTRIKVGNVAAKANRLELQVGIDLCVDTASDHVGNARS